jgi:hypothetical protein
MAFDGEVADIAELEIDSISRFTPETEVDGDKEGDNCGAEPENDVPAC